MILALGLKNSLVDGRDDLSLNNFTDIKGAKQSKMIIVTNLLLVPYHKDFYVIDGNNSI